MIRSICLILAINFCIIVDLILLPINIFAISIWFVVSEIERIPRRESINCALDYLFMCTRSLWRQI